MVDQEQDGRASTPAAMPAEISAPASLQLPSGPLDFPAFLPDATLGVVRSVDSTDLLNCGVPALVMNTYHLMQHPGSSTVQALGGLHEMCAWSRPILTDSGGFQAYSLIRENTRYGRLTDNGIVIQPDGQNRKFKLTPEKCIQLQVAYGADMLMCLDDCTHIDDSPEIQAASVRRTIDWARRCKTEFERLMREKRLDASQRPLLFAVIQGGGSLELRRECVEALLEIGFDGYGFGGWPLDADGHLLTDLLSYTRELLPVDFPMHALGVGHPLYVARCQRIGYATFDSALPTRDARRGRLYRFTEERPDLNDSGDWFSFVYIHDAKHIKAREPLDDGCDCLTCRHYSRGYLHHLFKSNDAAFLRLATLHNLRFMMRLMARLAHGA